MSRIGEAIFQPSALNSDMEALVPSSRKQTFGSNLANVGADDSRSAKGEIAPDNPMLVR
jgi:hypothetical protein